MPNQFNLSPEGTPPPADPNWTPDVQVQAERERLINISLVCQHFQEARMVTADDGPELSSKMAGWVNLAVKQCYRYQWHRGLSTEETEKLFIEQIIKPRHRKSATAITGWAAFCTMHAARVREEIAPFAIAGAERSSGQKLRNQFHHRYEWELVHVWGWLLQRIADRK